MQHLVMYTSVKSSNLAKKKPFECEGSLSPGSQPVLTVKSSLITVLPGIASEADGRQ